jgi:hypothetical protein
LSPILGIIASQNYPRITNSYESIATVLVGSGGSATISFTSIPSTYKHLQIRGIARSTRADFAIDQLYTRFNSDTGSNYSWHTLVGQGSGSATANWASTQTSISVGEGSFGTTTGGTFGGGVVDILDYTNTNKYKTVRSLSGVDLNGTIAGYGGWVALTSGLWRSGSAVTSIVLTPSVGTTFTQYSSFALYGIKG